MGLSAASSWVLPHWKEAALFAFRSPGALCRWAPSRPVSGLGPRMGVTVVFFAASS